MCACVSAPFEEMTESRNYSLCCRLCLEDNRSSLNGIYAGYSNSDVLAEKINALIGVQITETDQLSTMLCGKCRQTIDDFDDYKKQCLSNQQKLKQWSEKLKSNELENSSVRVKVEPTDDHQIIGIDEDDDGQLIAVKSEPIDAEEYVELPPPSLTPNPPANEAHEEGQNETAVVVAAEEVTAVENEQDKVVLNWGTVVFTSNRQCSVCDREFSTPGNRRKHERFMHGAHVELKPKQVENPTAAGLTNGEATEKEQEKIEFAAGLCLQSKSATPPKQPDELTRIENTYLERSRLIITMMNKIICACHNQSYGNSKKLMGHLRMLYSWLPTYTCYNCLVVYDGRSSKMKHAMRCPKVEMETLIRLSEIRQRPESKVRVYQNYKCMQCNYLFGFYEDFCEHVDLEHVADDGPYECTYCKTSFTNADSFRQHIHKLCYLGHHCDICHTLLTSADEFRQHCEQLHDTDNSFQFLQVHPKFVVMSNIEINNMLLESKQRQEEEEKAEEEAVAQPPTPPSPPVVRPSKVPLDPKLGPTKCTHCEKVYSNYSNMLRHLKQFHNIEPVVKTQRTACPVCGNVFSNYYNMLRHKKIHDDDLKTFECAECPERFRLNVELKEHISTLHSGTRTSRTLHKCDQCGDTFKNMYMLEMHQMNEHVYTCEECGKDYYKFADYEQHRNNHLNITLTKDPKTQNYRSVSSPEEGEIDSTMPVLENEEANGDDDEDTKKHKCLECNKEYAGSRGLWVHNKRYHPERQPGKDFPKECHLCNKTLLNLPGWIMHKQMHERTMAKNAAHAAKGAMGAKGDDDSDYHTCKKCFKVFSSKYNLRTHMKSHGIHISPSRSYLKTGKFSKTFWCDICHQACQGLSELNKHKQDHDNEEETDASRPNKKFKTEPNEEHPAKQVYCKYCRIPFEDIDGLNFHMEEEHDEAPVKPVKPMKTKPAPATTAQARFPCELCKKVFSTSSALCSHQGWHKRGKVDRILDMQEKLQKKVANHVQASPKFRCITCSKAFNDDTSLQLHILEAHREINATRLFPKCSVCGHECRTQTELDAHEKLHAVKQQKEATKTGVVCKHCGKMFSRSDYLNIHVSRKHPELAPVGSFKCNQCDRVFEKQNALTIHLKVHERTIAAGAPQGGGGKVYKYSCSICHIGFDLPKDLRNHIIANHPF